MTAVNVATYDELTDKQKAYVDKVAKATGRTKTVVLKELQKTIWKNVASDTDDIQKLQDTTKDIANTVTGGVSGAVSGVSDFIKIVSDPKTWQKILLIAGGALVIIIGFALILTQTAAGKTVTKVATKGLI